jgi:osmotically-inducible protein OsmY
MGTENIEGRKRAAPRGFESEPADEWREEYARGGPVRSNEPERDYFFEQNASDEDDQGVQQAHGTRERARPRQPAALKPIQFGKESFRGRGPRNYRPTDDRIRERLCESLTDHAEIDAAQLELEVECGIVKLHGKVRDELMKDRLIAAIQDVYGVVGIVDRVELIEP